MGSEQNRFPQPQPPEPRKRWGGCFGALSCFGGQKGGKRVVPASRIPEANATTAQSNGPQGTGLPNHATSIALSLLAPPSSPASFTNSALPSTAPSPNCFLSLSANSPGGPSSTMFATGPYAHETQLVSPPVFSTFTTEPSTAPLTPPPELAHLTTPSSPDVPYAQFLSSAKDIRYPEKTSFVAANDLQATYSLYPGSPASGKISPISRISGDGLSSSFPEREFPPGWDPSISPRSDRGTSGRVSGHSPTDASRRSHDTNFFCPATFAEFYLDHNPPFPHTGGRLSVSKDSDVYSTAGNGNQTWQNTRSPKHDSEEIEAYRASFGFSADEIITTAQYVEIADVADESFSMRPFSSSSPPSEEPLQAAMYSENQKAEKLHADLLGSKNPKAMKDADGNQPTSCHNNKDPNSCRSSGPSKPGIDVANDDEEDIFSRMHLSKKGRKYEFGSSMSDAEIDYRRGRSLREGKLGYV